MIKTVLVLASAAAVVIMVLWPKQPPAITAAPMAPSISIQEVHAIATMSKLPVQQFEDQSVVFSGAGEQTR